MEPEMGSVTLPHCEEVQVYVSGALTDIVLMLTVGGGPGDGYVEVISPQLPEPFVVPTGASPTPVPIPGCTEITLHYHKEKGGPDSVDVSWIITD